jgi:hypothetical protein
MANLAVALADDSAGYAFALPAIENLVTVSPRIIVFVAAMALGMAAYNAWQRRRVAAAPSTLAASADG